MEITVMIGHEAKKFEVRTTITWEEKKRGNFVTTDWKTPLPFSCPPLFGGTERPSPEDLFLASIGTCTLTTILHICDRLRTEPKTLTVTTYATVQYEKVINDYEFSEIQCSINISGDKFLLERACDLTPKYCFIGNNIKPTIVYNFNIKSA
jgi:uncharacterized OsmC-like protein